MVLLKIDIMYEMMSSNWKKNCKYKVELIFIGYKLGADQLAFFFVNIML